ncbi:hypothetical protein E1301_Tti011559 [Triplophysa tibetana]|uniref:Uncharacterized protein n=1 Tax=Triplophysa tibetana TaxID=1572043 RepID=A0A5A9PFU4_9TELE|nr:hypothetical protein E1301_Tti011559 [Triplophysa tibetana]
MVPGSAPGTNLMTSHSRAVLCWAAYVTDDFETEIDPVSNGAQSAATKGTAHIMMDGWVNSAPPKLSRHQIGFRLRSITSTLVLQFRDADWIGTSITSLQKVRVSDQCFRLFICQQE